MSNNLWNRVADFFKEWDGEDMTKSMPLYVDELRQINSNRIELIRLERERKEIRNNTIDELRCKLIMYFADCQLIEENAIARDFFDGVIERIDEIAEKLKGE